MADEIVDYNTAMLKFQEEKFTEVNEKEIAEVVKKHQIEGNPTHINFTEASDEIEKTNAERLAHKHSTIDDHVKSLSCERRWWVDSWDDRMYYPEIREIEDVVVLNNKSNVINPTKLARLFVKHVPALVVKGPNPAIYTYNIKNGLWTSDESFIAVWMQNVFDALLDKSEVEFPGAYSPNKAIENAIAEVKRIATVLESKYSFDASMFSNLRENKGGVPLANGILCFNEKFEPELELYSPHWLFTVKTATGFNAKADISKAVGILSEWMPDTEEEERDEYGNYKKGKMARFKRLVQFPAQIIVQQYLRVSWKKTYYGYGPGNCGKTTFADAVGFTFGEYLGSKTKIHTLSSDFGKEAIAGKWFNTPDETHAKKGVNMDEFKDVYGSNKMEVNAKYKHPEVMPMIAVGYHAGNTMMKANDETRRDNAYLRRWIIYHFENEFPVDPQWESVNFTREFFEGLMNLAVNMASDILREKKLPWEMTADEVLAEFEVDDTLSGWIGKTFFEKYDGEKKSELELITCGYGIPVSVVNSFFSVLENVWNFSGGGLTNFGDVEALRDHLPTKPSTISTAMNMMGFYKYRARAEYLNDGNKNQRWWYYGLKFNKDNYNKVSPNKIP